MPWFSEISKRKSLPKKNFRTTRLFIDTTIWTTFALLPIVPWRVAQMASRLRVELAEDGWPHKNSGQSLYCTCFISVFLCRDYYFAFCHHYHGICCIVIFIWRFFDSEIIKLPASCFQDQTRSIMSMSPHHPANDATGFFILSNALGWLRWRSMTWRLWFWKGPISNICNSNSKQDTKTQRMLPELLFATFGFVSQAYFGWQEVGVYVFGFTFTQCFLLHVNVMLSHQTPSSSCFKTFLWIQLVYSLIFAVTRTYLLAAALWLPGT